MAVATVRPAWDARCPPGDPRRSIDVKHLHVKHPHARHLHARHLVVRHLHVRHLHDRHLLAWHSTAGVAPPRTSLTGYRLGIGLDIVSGMTNTVAARRLERPAGPALPFFRETLMTGTGTSRDDVPLHSPVPGAEHSRAGNV